MEITRGDNKPFKFKRTRKDGSVITELPKKMYITFKKNAGTNVALFQKTLEDGSIKYSEEDNYYRFEILPKDTENLGYITCYFDIEIITNDDKTRTIYKGELEIAKEYTHKENEV